MASVFPFAFPSARRSPFAVAGGASGPEFVPVHAGFRSGRSVTTSFFRASQSLRSSLPGGMAHHSPAGVAVYPPFGPLCRRGA